MKSFNIPDYNLQFPKVENILSNVTAGTCENSHVYKYHDITLDNFLASKHHIKNIIPTVLESKCDVLDLNQ